MHLLLVEDDLELGAELQRALSGYGLTSEWVRGTRHARAMTEGECDDDTPHFACVLLDSRLPDGDGIDLITELKKVQPGARVVAMSGGGRYLEGSDYLKLARGIGAHSALMKPFTWAQLQAAMDQALANQPA